MSAPSWDQMWQGTVEAVAALACGETPLVLRATSSLDDEPATVALLGPSVYDRMVERDGFDPLAFPDLAGRWAS